jgi:hypothetical protein
VLVAVVVGLNALGAYAEGQASTPTDQACMTMLDYFRSSPGWGEGKSDAWDRLHYLKGRLDTATGPEAVAIGEYLAYFRQDRGAGPGPTDLVFEPYEVEVVDRVGPVLMRAAQACTDLSHPELQDYLNEISDEDNVPF